MDLFKYSVSFSASFKVILFLDDVSGLLLACLMFQDVSYSKFLVPSRNSLLKRANSDGTAVLNDGTQQLLSMNITIFNLLKKTLLLKNKSYLCYEWIS